ncbi:MAG: CcmD family protein [Bacteroidetes bacterium]|nr:CcmD family protein [Bacteroidota bacterium]MBK8362736.1 CcmD family protein [Bacteroidota bacterium]MBK9412556.1 CcmD family protein [Bacteroidota bacterium]MBL0032132.1 CcmD family protein [Bacteroidota bacterium]MBP6426665.1 CcmD family protein [Bacteroidia bacterium]
MKKNHLLFYSILLSFLPLLTFAQGSTEEMADIMRSNGKIFVVIGVISIILLGILIFLLIIDKKVRVLEKNQHKK